MAVDTLDRWHSQRTNEIAGEPLGVKRIGDDRRRHRICCACVLRENQYAGAQRVLRGDELLCYEVHPVSQRSHERDVGEAIELCEHVMRVRPIEVANGNPVRLAEPPVDPADHLFDGLPKLGVFRDVGPGRDRNLDEDDLAPPLRPPFEHPLEPGEPFRHALQIVEAVDGENHPPRPERRPEPGHIGDLLGRDLERLEIDRRRKHAHLCRVVAALDGAVVAHDVTGRARGSREVRRPALGVEANQVEVEHPIEQLSAPRHGLEHVRGGERHVKEQPDPPLVTRATQRAGSKQQVIVVDPDRRPALSELDCMTCIAVVRLHICIPIAVLITNASGEAMKQRPQRAVAEPGVELLAHGGGKIERRARRLNARVDRDSRNDATFSPAPSEPNATLLVQGRLERRDQAPHLAGSALRIRRRAIGHDDERMSAAPRHRCGRRERQRLDAPAARRDDPPQERAHRVRPGDHCVGTMVLASVSDRDRGVTLRELGEHVLVGDVIPDRDQPHPIDLLTDPLDRESLVCTPLADLEQLDADQALEARMLFEPLVAR